MFFVRENILQLDQAKLIQLTLKCVPYLNPSDVCKFSHMFSFT